MKNTCTQIHTLTIKRSGQKQLFQIKLPKNAACICGIQVTIEQTVLPIVIEEDCDPKGKTE
jgi:hypothetical protein